MTSERSRHEGAERGAPPGWRTAAGQPLVRSRLEAKALRELGVPTINGRVGNDEVDLRWGDLVVELDHDQTHGTKWARERDARKDQRHEGAGARRSSASRYEHDLADVAALGDDPVRLGRAVERDRIGDHRLHGAVLDELGAAASIHGSSVPRSFHRVSMFSPITALEDCICSIRLKPRSIGSASGRTFA